MPILFSKPDIPSAGLTQAVLLPRVVCASWVLHVTSCTPHSLLFITALSCALQFVVEDDEEKVRWWKNHRFWLAVANILVTELLLIAAIIMLVRYKHYKVIWFEWWRWLFFFSGALSPTNARRKHVAK